MLKAILLAALALAGLLYGTHSKAPSATAAYGPGSTPPPPCPPGMICSGNQ